MLFAPAPAYNVIFTKEFLMKLPVCLTAFTTHSIEHELLFCRFEDKVFYIDTSVVYYPSAIITYLAAKHLHLSIHQFSSRSTDWYLSGNIPDFYQKISNLLTVAEYSVVCGVLINTVHISYYLFKLLSVTFHALNT